MKNKIKVLSSADFAKMQEHERVMLQELDRVCRKNGIKYTIFGGTLLGAVRHKGFIPWDDDADVCMLREEYEKFRRASNQLNPDICFFQDHKNDSEYRWGYGKLRRSGTVYIRAGQEHIKCKTGVFLDVFPLDDIPKTTIGQMLQDFHCFCLRKILWSEVGKMNETGFMKSWYSILSRIPTDWVFKQLERYTKKSRNDSPNLVRTLCYTSIGKLYRKHPIKERYGMPKSWFLNLSDYNFDGLKLRGISDYDACLSFEYGDYMTPPPVDKRQQHAPVSDFKF